MTTPDETNKAWICEQVENNLGLVHLLANRHATSRTPFDDLFQEGIFGLWRAIEKFDPQRNIKFSSYAAPWIRTYMRRYVNRVIAPGVNEQPLQQWRREGGVDLHASQIENWTHKHSDITLIDVVEPDTATASEHTELHAAVKQQFEQLSERHQQVLRDRFGLDGHAPVSLTTVGKHLGVSRERVRQIELQALEKLRSHNAA